MLQLQLSSLRPDIVEYCIIVLIVGRHERSLRFDALRISLLATTTYERCASTLLRKRRTRGGQGSEEERELNSSRVELCVR